jgi:tetratricopeptide (TPR) repeat protein
MPNDEKPRRSEVLEQLEKIVESRYFTNAGTQGKVLRKMVESALSGDGIKQQDLQTVTDTNFGVDSHKGRQNALFVRRKLQLYYANEGIDDLVLIELPPGRSYKAIFRYNSKAAAVRALRKARKFSQRPDRYSVTAFVELCRARRADPQSSLVRAEMGLLALKVGLHENIFSTDGVPGFSSAEYHGKEAVEVDPNSWGGHIVLGATYLLQFRWSESREAFIKALGINKAGTERSLWYAAYQLTMGNTIEALRISEEQAMDAPENARVQMVHAFFLYLARRYEEALSFLKNLVTDEYDEEILLMLKGVIWLAQGKARRAFDSFEEMNTISERERDFLYRIRDRYWVKRQDIRREYCLGFKILSLMKANRKEEATEMMVRLRREYPAKPFQRGLGYMALGDNKRALIWLRRAVKKSDCLLNWLHLFPLFDTVRNDPIYTDIMKDHKAMVEYCALISSR